MIGPAPIVDFDGTLAVLDVDWAGLRARLGVASLQQLWSLPADDCAAGWAVVRDAEITAAASAQVRPWVGDLLADIAALAVLSDNSEAAIRIFLDAHPCLAERVRLVVGRESLHGTKRDPAVFARGFARCLGATASARGDQRPTYIGDADYELALADSLGALVVDARLLDD